MPSNLVELLPTEICEVTSKPSLVVERPTITVREALRKMADNNIVSLPIYSHDSDNIVTIVNIIDILNYIIKEAVSDEKLPSSIHSEKARNLDKQIETVMTLDSDQESYRIFKTDANEGIKKTLEKFSKRLHRSLVIDYDNKVPPFILTQSDVIKYVQAHPECLPTIDFKSSLRSLGLIRDREIVIGHDNESALNVYRGLAENRLIGIAIVNSEHELVGNLSASDLRGLSYESIDNLVLPVLEFLAKLSNCENLLKPVTATPETSLEMALKLLTVNRIHRVWIIDDKRHVKDVVTLTDLISFFIQQ
ncbi:20227_t:CDS:2 [Dentiscutata erythropus]|uniref:20227_t:CDS:1 n=1 Tax=Dentiscutata erythropus TaxID=1348616 RepID=A0A9N9P812_9GLOM|nr:20227_t:CDS:2 [Dentiscutata erythropus]